MAMRRAGRKGPLTPALSPVGRGGRPAGKTPSPHWGEGWGEGVSPRSARFHLTRRAVLATPFLAAAPARAWQRPASWVETMPLLRWGIAYPNFDRWAAFGISGSFVGALRDPPDANQVASVKRMLDAAQRAGHAFGLYLHPLNSARFGPAGSANPASPEVRAHAMATLSGWMDAVGDHPALRHMLLNSEYPARWQQPAAVLTAAMAIAAKRRRPDLLTWTDPWRDAPTRVPPGVDMLGSWTYGHPHPLRQLIVPFLRAGAGADRAVMQTVSLYLPVRWSAAAEEQGAWRIAPPDPSAIALWLAFAQAPVFLSIYAPSTADPFGPQAQGLETWQALGKVHATAIAPFASVLRRCQPVPATVDVLLAAVDVSRLAAATRAPGWDAEQAWPLAAMLAMQGIPFAVRLEGDAESGRPTLRLADAPQDVAFLRGVDGGLANRIAAADAAQRLAAMSEALARRLGQGVRTARHAPETFHAAHDGGAVTWHVLVNHALEGPRGATYREAGRARRETLSLRAPPGRVWWDAIARRRIAARDEGGFATLTLDLPASGGTVLASLPAPPTAPRLERRAPGTVLQAPFAGVMPYDVTAGDVTQRVATERDGTLVLSPGPVRATCALSGQSATLDI
jgi:hypothetical protein